MDRLNKLWSVVRTLVGWLTAPLIAVIIIIIDLAPLLLLIALAWYLGRSAWLSL